MLPLIFRRFSQDGMVHIQGLLSFHSVIRADYFIALFWDGLNSVPLGPVWGGIINPVGTSLFLLGLLVFIEMTDLSSVIQAVMIALLLFLPGLLTRSFINPLRISQILPFIFVSAAAGLGQLCSWHQRFKPWLLAGILLLALSSIDVYHFWGPYTDLKVIPPSRQWRTLSSAHAYQILRNESEKDGPLFVFSEFNVFYDDKTLNLACYPFDGLQNPKLRGIEPGEIALVLNVHYSPFIQKRFPLLRYERLEKDSQLGLYLIPTSEIPPATLKLWKEADQVYRGLNLAIKNKNPLQPWSDFLPSFAPLEALDRPDPILMSVYWEKVAFFKDLVEDYPGAAVAYQKALEEGYPAAHLYLDRGTALKWMGKTKESVKDFKKAADLSKLPGA